MTEVVVLGLGNLLRRDEGLGVVALQRLRDSDQLPGGVDLVDGGTLGLDLISHVEGARRLLVLDAVLAEGEPGGVVELRGDQVPVYFGIAATAHDFSLPALLATCRLRGTGPEEVVVLGLRPESCELGWGLTEPVDRRIDALVEAATRQLHEWVRTPCTR